MILLDEDRYNRLVKNEHVSTTRDNNNRIKESTYTDSDSLVTTPLTRQPTKTQPTRKRRRTRPPPPGEPSNNKVRRVLNYTKY
jgi:hypothetical protein